MSLEKRAQTSKLKTINIDDHPNSNSTASSNSKPASSASESDKSMKQAQRATRSEARHQAAASRKSNRVEIANQIMTYSRFDDPAARIKYLQTLLNDADNTKNSKPATSDQLMHHNSIINKLAYVFPDTGADDIQEIITNLQSENVDLFKNDGLTIGTDSDLSTVQYKFVRKFHLLGRTDSKDLFKVVLTWKLLSPELNVVEYSRRGDISSQLEKLNRYIDGSTSEGVSTNSIKREMAKTIAAIQFLEDLNSGDKEKIKELTHYREDLLEGKELIQPLAQQGAYETIASIKSRAFSSRPSFEKPDDDYSDFIADIRNLPANFTKDGGMFSKEHPLNRHETINALFNGELEVNPVLENLRGDYDKQKQELEDAETKEKTTTQAEESAVQLVQAKQTQLVDDIQEQIQKALDELGKTLISPVKLKTTYQAK